MRVRGEPVALSAREFALLEALLARPGAVLSRAQLEEKLYGWNEEVGSNAVEVHLHALRRKLPPDTIRNVRGVGWTIARAECGSAMTSHRSIRRELLVWLAGGLVIAIAVAAVATYLRAREEANEIFDYQLRQMAASLTGVPLAGTPGGLARRRRCARRADLGSQRRPASSCRSRSDPLPQYAQLGFNTIRTSTGDWRVFSTLAGDEVVQVAQPMSARRELAASMALRTIVPLLVVAPLLALLVSVRRRARTRAARARRRRRRQARSRRPAPLDEAGLPTKCGRSRRRSTACSSDSIARSARSARSSPTRRTSCARRSPPCTCRRSSPSAPAPTPSGARRSPRCAPGLARATHLVEQLLTLAREEPGVERATFAPVNLAALARNVVADHARRSPPRAASISA